MKTLVIVNPLHSISAKESVVRVVENAPIASAVCVHVNLGTKSISQEAFAYRAPECTLDTTGHEEWIRLPVWCAIADCRTWVQAIGFLQSTLTDDMSQNTICG